MKEVDSCEKLEAVFALAAFQFCGHIDEYLIRHTRHLGLLYLQTRFGKGGHLFRRYENGELVEERRLSSSGSIVGYYTRWLWHWHRELSRFCRGHREVLALFEHPLGGVGMSLRRRARHVFWQWDYFPSGNAVDRLFNAVAGYCARRCDRYIALTSAIGKAMGLPKAKVVMLGVTPPMRFGDPQSNRILMVGQLRHGQGVEDVLDFISANPQYQLSLMGAAANGFEAVINERIAAAKMADRVYFPNKFVSDMELREEAAKCFVSLALYDTSAGNLTHYADPGKVKSSIEMGLPVVMTRISDIVPFIERFKAGEIIDSVADLPTAIDLVRRNYTDYQAGLRVFAAHFDTETYYKDALFDGCIRDENLVSYSHANKFEDNLHDERSVRGGIHPFAGSRESVVADFGRVRMLAQEVSAELLRTLQHGERASVREESAALIVAAKRLGMYVPYQERGRFGDLKRRVSGESEVYDIQEMNPLLSICIPTYNRQAYLKELVEMLLPQIDALPKGTVELVISNNVSTDGTATYGETINRKYFRFWTNETNIGGDRNFLKCIKEAHGEYVWLVGDDDIVPEGAVAKVVAILRSETPDLLIADDLSEAKVYAGYGDYLEQNCSRGAALRHTLISANIFRRSAFDGNFAVAKLYTQYAHMFGIVKGLDGKVVVAGRLLKTRPVKAEFSKFPSCLCVKQAIYLAYLAKRFNQPRFRWFAVVNAINLPMEYASRAKNWLKKRLT